MTYSARRGASGGFAFASEEGKRHGCCAKHKVPHEKEVDADACFYVWAMGNIEEYTAPPELGDSACQLYPCDRRTTKGMRNAICPHGRYLCDVHRKTEVFAGFLPFSSVGYDISEI